MPSLAGAKSDLLPGDETLRWFVRGSRKSEVDLGDFGPCLSAGILEVEGHAKTVPVGHVQIGVGKCGVRKAEAEGKQRSLVLCVVPLVSNFQAFGVIGVEYAGLGIEGQVRRPRSNPSRFRDDRVWQVGLAGRESDGQLAGWVYIAEEDVGDGVATSRAGEPGLEHRLYLVEPRHQRRSTRLQDHNGVRVERR